MLWFLENLYMSVVRCTHVSTAHDDDIYSVFYHVYNIRSISWLAQSESEAPPSASGAHYRRERMLRLTVDAQLANSNTGVVRQIPCQNGDKQKRWSIRNLAILADFVCIITSKPSPQVVGITIDIFVFI